MQRQRVLAIGLDGYEQSLGDRLITEGALPILATLRDRSARFLLDHGAATRTGLAWEHVASGQSPEEARRDSAVHFDKQSYEVWHDGTSLTPFPAKFASRTVVFDPPYFNLRLAPSVRGITNWGAHDPGVNFGTRPAELADEFLSRFGAYPARNCLYDVVWPSISRTRQLGELLVRSTEVRTRASRWLIEERFPDWDFALVVAGETHSAIEAFWHGIDAEHPLHAVRSAQEAAKQLRAVYTAVDRLVGNLVSAFPDATVVTFAMNGMGPNRSDVASMILLSELLYRAVFSRPLLRVPNTWSRASEGLPMLHSGADWSHAVKCHIKQFREPLDLMRRVAVRVLPENIRSKLRSHLPDSSTFTSDGTLRLSLNWMPTCLYQPYWRSMPFFALPSFYDGRIRLNLAGRESDGTIALQDYDAVCDEVESLVRSCRDIRTGEPVVDYVERHGRRDPLSLGPSESDLTVVWRGAALGFEHPTLGRVGPVPFRRTGGHTGPYGMAYFAGDGIIAGDYGVRSSFNVVPTMIELLGQHIPTGITGESLIPEMRERTAGRT